MARTAILSVRVVSDTKQAQKGAADVATSFEKFEKRLDKASIYAGVAGAAIAKLGYDAYKAGAALEQSTGAVDTVFKNYSKQITDFAATSWESVGLSQNKTQEMATILGSQLKNLGTPMGQVSGQTTDLIKLGSDLAATYGGDTSQAVEALSSLLRGERDPIEKYGVTINQAMLNAEKAALGLDGLTGAADRNADMQATMSLLTKQTADATGQFAAEANTAEGAAQRNAARWETVQAQLGQKLLPVMIQVSTALVAMAGWVSENSDLVFALAGVLGGAAVAVLGLNAAIKTGRAISTMATGIAGGTRTIMNFTAGLRDARAAGSAFTGVAGTLGGKVAALAKSIGAGALAAGRWVIQTTILTAKLIAQKTAQLAIAAASKIAAAAQWLWNAATSANPLMLIIVAIIAVIALLIMNWDKVKAVALVVWDALTVAATWFWDNVLKPVGEWIASVFVLHWEALKLVATAVWEAISTAARWLWDNVLKPVGQWIATNLVRNWEIMKIAAQLAWRMIQNGAQQVWNFIQQVGGWISGTFSAAWDGLRSAGVNALNAIISPVQSLIGWLQDAWSWVSKLFSKGGKLIGKAFGFSAAVDVGAPATAAIGSAPSLPALLRAPGSTGDVTNVFNIDFPNYTGSRDELVAWLRDALKRAERDESRVIYA